MNQKGSALILLLPLLIVVGLVVGVFYLGRLSNKSASFSTQQITPDTSSPKILTISTPPDVNSWILYKIKALNLQFKLSPTLANKYGKLVESEANGKRGSELKITFIKDPKGLIITAQSPEYTPIPPLSITEPESLAQAIGGPGLSVPSVFKGFKYENEVFYGIEPFGQLRVLPKDQVTQYHVNGRDILKIKALYGEMGMISHKIFPENPPKIWGIINGTGNQVYPGLTVQGVLDNDLTEQLFEQVLSTFSSLEP